MYIDREDLKMEITFLTIKSYAYNLGIKFYIYNSRTSQYDLVLLPYTPRIFLRPRREGVINVSSVLPNFMFGGAINASTGDEADNNGDDPT